MEIMNVLIKVIIIVVIILLTTFGWKPTPKYKADLSVDEQNSLTNMKRIVEALSQDIGARNYFHYANLKKSASYIQESLEEAGYPVVMMPYTLENQTFHNIIAEKPAAHSTKATIIIGAHYDSCFNPGADDNASGVAGLIEMARLLKDVPLNHNVKFIAFVNEEPPFFFSDQMGSFVYAQKAKQAGEDIKAVVIFEMLGFYSDRAFSQKYLPLLGPFYPNRANFITIVGNFPSRHLVKGLFQGFKKGSDFPVERIVSPSYVPGIYFSDHWSFWKAGYPAVMITDTAYLRSSHYHEQTDLPDTLDYPRMTKAVYGLKSAVLQLDQQLK